MHEDIYLTRSTDGDALSHDTDAAICVVEGDK